MLPSPSPVNIDRILPRVQKPARYTGGELHSVSKDWDRVPVRMALSYPDIYEIGMSNNGLAILYDIVNRHSHFLCERVYMPWLDMEEQLRANGVPLFSLETRRPIRDFDIFGISLGWEMTYTNVLSLLDLAGIPLRSREREHLFPIVMGGGSGALNGEPMADFFDVYLLGEGEEVLTDFCLLVQSFKAACERRGIERPGRTERAEFLMAAARIPGVYVPELYQVAYHPDGRIDRIAPIAPEIPRVVGKRQVEQMLPTLTTPIVPFMQTVHDRASIEIQRGCTRGCRFCQAGIIYRPLRERTHEEVIEAVEDLMNNCGYTEFSLVSLSTSDYHDLPALVRKLHDRYRHRGITISLPSLRVETVSVDLVQAMEPTKKGGFTFAPEAGSQRLRQAINKPLTEDDLLNAVEAAFSHGWSHIKLYYMIGLPSETLEDVMMIPQMVQKAMKVGRRHGGNRAKITVSCNIFVPKPHSQYQWAPQERREALAPKIKALQEGLRIKGVHLGWSDESEAQLEAVLALGDRRLGEVIYRAWSKGAKFDAWSDYFKWELWQEAFQECGLDPDWYAYRERPLNETLPWSHISDGVMPGFLWREYRYTWLEKTTEDCRDGDCSACGFQDDPNCQPKFQQMLAQREHPKLKELPVLQPAAAPR
ncbi:MAG: TIGR03960 family B12-binding radical SAM protein [Dehalococcoidia bacterium]|nr:TIGR03960 family B12-binding radical SAM protein [Dehalococcoidia bacterium]